ncbi:MAG: DNA polymerase III subunit beta [Candidatus Saccharimonadales bacterium]
MKLVVTQENLARALGIVGRVAQGKLSLPVLNNILLKAENNQLILAATNLEIAITEHIGAKLQSEGSITVPARLITDYVANLPKGTVSLELDKNKLHITTDNYRSTVNGMPADEFPELPQIENPIQFKLDAQSVKKAITQTVLTASHDETRPILTGVYLHTFNSSLFMAATDGYRLSEKKVAPIDQDVSAIIPVQTLHDVARVLPDDCDEIEVLLDAQQIRFLMNDIEITSRLIDGTYPDYRQLIPSSTEISFTTAKEDLVRISKIASLFAKESGGSITIKTDTVAGNVSIHSLASQIGENTSELQTTPSGDGQVTLNSRYLIEALGVIEDNDIDFGFSGKLAPCVVRAQKNSDYTHIIMPLKS